MYILQSVSSVFVFLTIHGPGVGLSPLHLSFATMKKLLIGFLLLSVFCACNNDEQSPQVSNQPENDLDAARTFIRDALDGKFEHAKQLMLRDSTNDQTMDVIERNYEHMSQADRVGYRNASIQIHDTKTISDTTLVTYSNSYKNQNQNLKLIKVNGQWLVDLKYTFQAQH